MSARFVFGGIDSRGNARTGVTFDLPAEFVRERFDAGWRRLEIRTDDEARRLVGAIEPSSETGRRAWWGETRGAELAELQQAAAPVPAAEQQARRAAAVAVLTDFEAFRDAGAPARDGRDLAWAYWADRLAGMLSLVLDLEPETAARAVLAELRGVLEVFDWATDDRQYALEQIDDIMQRSQP